MLDVSMQDISVLKNGIETIIQSIPATERDMLIEMLDSFNVFEEIKEHYLIPFELYCDKCNIRYLGYKAENLMLSLERLDKRITQKEDGTIDLDCKSGSYCRFGLLNHLSIDFGKEVIKYSFHSRMYPYILAYHLTTANK